MKKIVIIICLPISVIKFKNSKFHYYIFDKWHLHILKTLETGHM